MNPPTRLFMQDKDISPSGQKFSPGDSAALRHTGEKFLIPCVRYMYMYTYPTWILMMDSYNLVSQNTQLDTKLVKLPNMQMICRFLLSGVSLCAEGFYLYAEKLPGQRGACFGNQRDICFSVSKINLQESLSLLPKCQADIGTG